MHLVQEWSTELRYKPYHEWPTDYLEELKKTMNDSTWRLAYHIQPTTGLLNDPNGFSYFNGKWHIFYQAYPLGPVHGVKSWYHLTSINLIDWQDEGLALLPGGMYDSHGVYSGSALAVDDHLFLAYTGNVRDQNWQRHSFQLGAWLDNKNQIQKLPEPLIVKPPNGYTQEIRDPQIFIFNQQYYLIIGAQNKQEEGKILTYKSSDLTHWQCLGELTFSNDLLGFMVECPNLIFIDNQAVLLFCPQGLDQEVLPYQNIYPNTYVVADGFDGETNTLSKPSPLKNLDEGFDVYATQAFNTPDGRALAISWMGLPEVAYPTDEEGWAHCLSLVKELKLEGGKLFQRPVNEMKTLRLDRHSVHGTLGSVQKIYSPKENRYELQLDFDASTQGTLTLFADEDTNTGLTLSFDTQNGTMTMNRENAGTPFATEFGTVRTFEIPQKDLSLQIFVDHSVVEVFINQGEKVASARVFPKKDQTTILLEGTTGVFSGEYWTLRPMK
ncbi:MAG: sucrose-6-phosphate hydrolase [Enterococcus viikkiensis]|uniref:Sucrose-6-phosphate hydrolase n=1 Tax=Enterococcus viikkiensis TaxID=930854 RepID=A0ABU3FM00_9ENTE|nr:sucrose-6-phosphate hydrolase [Enterococcus viikkiensis]MDT2826999.1 sucrose-6-phosphate hydrolase [Enterococcus viikkiensis]